MAIQKHINTRITLFAFFLVSLIILIGCTAQTIAITPSPLPTNTSQSPTTFPTVTPLLPTALPTNTELPPIALPTNSPLTPTALPTNTPLPPTAIGPTPTPMPRPTLAVAEVKTLAAEFDRISQALGDAWNKHDTNLMRQSYTDDIVFYWEGNTPDYIGIDSVNANNIEYLNYYRSIATRLVGTYIGRAQGIANFEDWNVERFTEQNPLIGFEWYTLRNGKISELWLFYDPVYFARQGYTFASTPLKSYETAWSSGDPEKVASLYDPQVVRQDTLFGVSQQGSTAVKEFATNFFAWYPGVRLELLQSFEHLLSDPVIEGGVYAIHVSDKAGKPCNVKAIILFEITKDKITKEWLFYNADSLITCGWAQ